MNEPFISLSHAPWWFFSLLLAFPAGMEALYAWVDSSRITNHWLVSSIWRMFRTAVQTAVLVSVLNVFSQVILAVFVAVIAALFGRYAVVAVVDSGKETTKLSSIETGLLSRWYKSKVYLPSVVFVTLILLVPGPILDRWDYVSLTLKWKHQAQFAGFYVAHREGLYAAKNLKVKIVEGGPEQNPFEYVQSANGNAFGVGDPMELIVQNGRSLAKFTAIGVVFQKSPAVWFAREGEILKKEDLRGKSIAVSTGITNVDRELSLWLAENGFGAMKYVSSEDWLKLTEKQKREKAGTSVVGVKLRRADLDSILHFLARNVDIWSGYASNELRRARETLKPIDLINLREAAFLQDTPIYGDVVFMKGESPINDDVAQRFLCATIEGWTKALNKNDEAEVIDVVMEWAAPLLTGFERKEEHRRQRDMLRDLREEFVVDQITFGSMKKDKWDDIFKRMSAHHVEIGIDKRDLNASTVRFDADLLTKCE